MIHTCADCGLVHDQLAAGGDAREAAEVAIARINADRDVQVAKIGARQERDWNESMTERTEIEADASVEVAVAEAEIIGPMLADADPAPVDSPVIVQAPDVDVSQEADPEELPPVEGSPAPEVTERKRGLGMW